MRIANKRKIYQYAWAGNVMIPGKKFCFYGGRPSVQSQCHPELLIQKEYNIIYSTLLSFFLVTVVFYNLPMRQSARVGNNFTGVMYISIFVILLTDTTKYHGYEGKTSA